jgi:hypothetical protein
MMPTNADLSAIFLLKAAESNSVDESTTIATGSKEPNSQIIKRNSTPFP